MKKRVIALVLATMMVFAGCGQTNTTTSKETEANKPSSEVVSSETNASSEAVEESKYPDYLNLDGFRPIVKEGEEITLTAYTQRASNAEVDVNDMFIVKWIEEGLNIDLDIEDLKGDGVAERRSLALSSNELPDFMINMNFTNQDIVTYGVEGGQLLAISDYFSEELTPNIMAMLEKYPEIVASCTAPDGKIYSIPAVAAEKPGTGVKNVQGQCLFINSEYMKAIGRDTYPTTLDDFVEMLREIKALDPKDFGVDEIWPLVATMGYDQMFMMQAMGWVGAAGGSLSKPMTDAQTGKVVVPIAQEEKATEYITLYNTLYNEGLIHIDYFTNDKQASRAIMSELACGVMGDSNTTSACPDVPLENWVFQGPVSSKWNEKAAVTGGSAFYAMGAMVVSADTEYPELCVRLIDYLCSPEGSAYSAYGPAAVSEDTLGEFCGYTINENGGEVYQDVVDGKAASAWWYLCNAIRMGGNWSYDENAAYQYMWEQADPTRTEYGNTLSYLGKQKVSEANGHRAEALPEAFMSADQAVEYTDLFTVIDEYVTVEFAKFVTGRRALTELPDFFKELESMGMDDYVALVDALYADYQWDGTFN